MPAPAASNVTLSPIPDLPGGAAPAIHRDGGEPAFDALLQPASDPRRVPTVDDNGHTNSPSSHDSGRGPLRAPAAQDDEPSAPVARDASDEAAEGQADSLQKGDRTSTTAPQADNSKTQEEQPAPEQITTESLAGLAIQASAQLPTGGAPAATKANDTDLAESGPATTRFEIPSQAIKAVRPDLPSRQAAAAPSSAIQRLSRPDRSYAEIAEDSPTVAGKSVERGAVKPGSGQRGDDKNIAAATIASNLQGYRKEKRDALDSAPLPDEQPHESAENTTAGTLGLDIPRLTVVDRAPAPPAAGPVTTPQPPEASPMPPANSLNPPPAPNAATNAAHSRLPAEVLAPPPVAPARRSPVEIDSARLLSRVARAFSAARERDGEIRLRLSPPELGALRLAVRVQDGALVAQLHTETDAARAAILENLAALRDRLADQGIRLQRFDVDLMQRQPGGMTDQPGGRQHDLPAALSRGFAAPRPRTQAVSTPAPLSVAASPGGLNVIV